MASKISEVLERLYKEELDEQYNHPIQTRPKPKPGITSEEPERIQVKDFGDEGGNTSFSAKHVNKSSNREFEDEEDDKQED
jgi:hypothetical protein